MQTKLFRRDFTLVVIGQIISLFGNAILRFALPLYLLRETGSSTLFGVVTACSFAPMVILSMVGEIYRRIAWNNRGKHSTVWRCCTRVEHGPKGCDAPTIQESVLQNGVAKAINEVFGNSSAFLPILKENMQAVIGSDMESQLAEIDGRLKELQQELLKQANAKKDYTELADKIYALREQRQNVLAAEAEQDGRRQRMEEMKKLLEEQADIPLEYDEQLVRKLVEKVTVYEEELVVEFKSGLEIRVEI